MRRPLAALLASLLAAAPLALAPAAHAAATAETVLPAAGLDIAAGGDGTYWITLPTARGILRVSAGGQPIGSVVDVGGTPSAIAAGPDGRLWVARTDDNALAAVTPATGAYSTVPVAGCAPRGLATNSTTVYVACGTGSVVSVAATGAPGSPTTVLSGVDPYDLAVSGGFLYVPDRSGDRVVRTTLGAPAGATSIGMLGNTGPYGITVVGGTVWVTLVDSDQVATFPATQSSGTVSPLATPGLDTPFGLAPSGHGTVYVASNGNDTVLDISPGGGSTTVGLPAGASPWRLAATPDGVLVTTTGRTAVTHVADAAPSFGAASATATSPTSVKLAVPLDTRGNAATVQLDYGTSPAYDSAVVLGTAAARATGATTVAGTLDDLDPGTTYHLRFTATSSRGSTTTADTTVTTPPARPMSVKPKVKAAVARTTTTLRKLTLSGLVDGAGVSVTCKNRAKGCTFSAKQYAGVRAGTLQLGTLFAKPLQPGATVTIVVSAPGYVDAGVVVKTRRGRTPKVTTRG